MNLNTVLRNDYQYMDSDASTTSGRHAITLTNADGTSATASNAIKRQTVSNDLSQAEVGLVTFQCRWHVWKNDLSDTSFVPSENGGKITDADNNVWLINSVQRMTAGTRFEIETTLEGGSGLR